MKEKPKIRCPFFADDCAAFNYQGKCDGAVDIVYDPDGYCPFYKNIEKNYEEHCSAINRLVQRGRFDLLDKYHKRELFD